MMETGVSVTIPVSYEDIIQDLKYCWQFYALAKIVFREGGEQYNSRSSFLSFRYIHLRMENFIQLDLNWQQESDAMHRFENKNQILEPLNIKSHFIF